MYKVCCCANACIVLLCVLGLLQLKAIAVVRITEFAARVLRMACKRTTAALTKKAASKCFYLKYTGKS
jgi:hypothetical protein